jgi:hypothetical protein
MKNTILSIILGMFIAISIQATTGIMSVKPVKPKSTIVKSFRAVYQIEQEIEDYTKAQIKNGYIVKCLSISEDESRSKAVLIMEKY